MSDTASIRVLIAGNDATFRGPLVAAIECEPLFELVGALSDPSSAVECAALAHPDVALIDVQMVGGGGVVTARGIARVSPGTKLIALSALADRESVFAMLEAGVGSYLVTGSSVGDIIETIRRAPGGGATLSGAATATVIEELMGQLRGASKAKQRHATRLERVRRILREDKRMQMEFQPIVELTTGTIVLTEALARFPATSRQDPTYWFKEATEVGLQYELEILAAKKAIAILPALPPSVALSINASPATLISPSFRECLAGADPARVVVELTEHAPIDDHERFNARLARLRALGVRLAVDDAGSGFASLRHILRLAPTYIKLDRFLIEGIEHDQSAQALAVGLISFAERSGATIIAEGIECQGQLDALMELGVRYGQGYFIAPPHPPPLLEILQRSPTKSVSTAPAPVGASRS